jgi:ASC-1-like (ASCH) protein
MAQPTTIKGVQKEWYEYIKIGTKTVEGRVDYDKWVHFCDKEIYWCDNNNTNDKTRVLITKIIKYDTIEEYLVAEGDKAAPHLAPELRLSAYMSIIDNKGHKVFDLEKIKNVGMVAIHFVILS